jgi:hypothetical protein
MLALSRFDTFCWPVKIRVRAKPIPLAPRQSPLFPASFPSQPELRIIQGAPELRRSAPRIQTFLTPDWRVIGDQDHWNDE